MDNRFKGQAFGLLAATFLMWGGVHVAGRLISDAVPAPLLACLRCCCAMLPLLWMSRGCLGRVHLDRADWKYFAAVGLLGYFLTIFCIQIGISLTGASMAALLNALTPVSVTLLAALVLKEPITPVKVACLILALALTAKYPPILVTTYGMAISLIGHIPVGIATAVSQPFTIDVSVVLVILYLGFFGSGVAQFTWVKSLSMLPASTCSLFYPLQPVFAAVLGALILGERFTPAFFLGLALISADVALSTWETKKLSGS